MTDSNVTNTDLKLPMSLAPDEVNTFLQSASPETAELFSRVLGLFIDDLESILKKQLGSKITVPNTPAIVRTMLKNYVSDKKQLMEKAAQKNGGKPNINIPT